MTTPHRFPWVKIQDIEPPRPEDRQMETIAADLDRHLRALALAARERVGELSEDERFAVAYCAGARITLQPTNDPFRMIWRTEPVAIARDGRGKFLVAFGPKPGRN